MKKYFQFVRRYLFSLFCFVLIWVLSLMPFFPETPLNNIHFIDKWTHLLMYGSTCSVLWIEYIRNHPQPLPKGEARERLFLWAWLAPILMSGLLELLQAYATTTRSGEWLDFVANSVGVTLGAMFGLLLMAIRRNRRLP